MGEQEATDPAVQKSASLRVIMATAAGTVLILLAVAFLFPGLNSFKLQFFSAAIEIDNQKDAFTLLDDMYSDEDARPYLDAWLEKSDYVSLTPPSGEVPEADRRKAAIEQAAKFSTLVPHEDLQEISDPQRRLAVLEEFSEKTSEQTLAGQLRKLAAKKDPPFNNIGFAASASKPSYLAHQPSSSNVIFLNANTDVASHFANGDVVALINPQNAATQPILVEVQLRSIAPGTHMHLNRRQWCELALQTAADAQSGIAPILIVTLPSGRIDTPAAETIASEIGADFLSAEYQPTCS